MHPEITLFNVIVYGLAGLVVFGAFVFVLQGFVEEQRKR